VIGVLRRIFGFMREEVPEIWRNVNNKELHNLYSSPNTNSSALNGNKMKHYTSKMKSEIKFCSSSFSVVTLPAISVW